MLYPNGQRVLAYPGRHMAGALAASGAMAYGGLSGARLNGTANFAKTASVPEGYAPKGAHVLPIKAGGMAGLGYSTHTASGNMLQGGPMEGAGSIAFTSADASLGLIISMSGTATINWTTAAGQLALTLGMDGTGAFALTGTAGLSMIVPFDGTGTFGLAGTADLRGNLSMAGEWTPYTELSPENLARTVWEAVAAQYTEPGTMGAKLNTASSGGVDLAALASAVWSHATRSLSGTQATQLAELWALQGLDESAPLTVTPTSRTAGSIAQAISGDGTTTSTVTRVP